jgi:hypothetical protein
VLTTLFMLVYGDYPGMHKQAIAPLLLLDPAKVSVRLWLNAVCLETFDWLLQHAPKHWIIYISSQNPPKYPVMRKLFTDPANPIVTPWVTWFDDDTNIACSDWLTTVEAFIKMDKTVTYFGIRYWKEHLPGVASWIQGAKWYTNRPFFRAGKKGKRRQGIYFMRGSYWWLKTSVLRELDWPDTRLRHNGGDTALAEAIWQAQLPQHTYAYGIAPELAPRRGRSESPAGSRHKFKNTSDQRKATMLGHMGKYKRYLTKAGILFVRLNEDLILVGGQATSAATRQGQAWLMPLHVSIAGRDRRLGYIAAVKRKPKPKVVRARKPLARRPASKQAVGKKITAGYMRAVPAAPKPARSKPAQPKPRVARSSRREVKTLKQLLQERHRKRQGIQ